MQDRLDLIRPTFCLKPWSQWSHVVAALKNPETAAACLSTTVHQPYRLEDNFGSPDIGRSLTGITLQTRPTAPARWRRSLRPSRALPDLRPFRMLQDSSVSSVAAVHLRAGLPCCCFVAVSSPKKT